MSFLILISTIFAGTIQINADTVMKYITENDTLYITTKDIVSIDTFNNNSTWIFHLTVETTNTLDSITDKKGTMYFYRENNWIRLNPYEITSCCIPYGLYIDSYQGNFMYEKGLIHIGQHLRIVSKKEFKRFLRKLRHN